MSPDANAPLLWQVPAAVAGKGLALAEDDFATYLIGRYLSTPETVSTITQGDPAAMALWGRKEVIVDLTPMGVITSSFALDQLNGRMALSAARLRFSEGLDLAHGQITTMGGAPAVLSQIRAGHRLRLQGVADKTRANSFAAYTDIVIGRVRYTDGSGRIAIDPVDLAARNLADVLKVATDEDEGTDTGARAQIAAQTSKNVTDQLVTGDSSWTHNSRLTRRGNTVTIYLDVTANVNQGSNNGVFQIPAAHRPASGSNLYFAVADSGSGALTLAYITTAGHFAHTFGRSAGQGTLGMVTYVANP